MKNSETIITDVLKLGDIKINGSRPWDMTVHDKRLYSRLLSDRELGLGESYMDGWWDCPAIDQMVEHIYSANVPAQLKPSPS